MIQTQAEGPGQMGQEGSAGPDPLDHPAPLLLPLAVALLHLTHPPPCVGELALQGEGYRDMY